MRSLLLFLLLSITAGCAGSEPGAALRTDLPNPETEPVDGLFLRSQQSVYARGDTALFALQFRPTADDPERSPMFGLTCTWRLERWTGAWSAVPLNVWREGTDGRYGCLLPGITFTGPATRREAFLIRESAERGPYRWCLDAYVRSDEQRENRTLCSDVFLIRAE